MKLVIRRTVIIIIIDGNLNLVPSSRWWTRKGIIFSQDWSPNLPVGCNWPPSNASGEPVLWSVASDGKKKAKSIIPLEIPIPVGVTIPVGGIIPVGSTHECKRMGVPTARIASQGKGTDTSECSPREPDRAWPEAAIFTQYVHPRPKKVCFHNLLPSFGKQGIDMN
jgi:hypothetical protein